MKLSFLLWSMESRMLWRANVNYLTVINRGGLDKLIGRHLQEIIKLLWGKTIYLPTSQTSVYVNSKPVTQNFLPTCKSITWRLITLPRLISLLWIVYMSDFQQILFIHVLKMFFISNDSSGFIRHAWTNTILITEQRSRKNERVLKTIFTDFLSC